MNLSKIIKNAGGVISHPFGSAVRSLLIAILAVVVEFIFNVLEKYVNKRKRIQKNTHLFLSYLFFAYSQE